MRRNLFPMVLARVLVPLTGAAILRLMAEPPPSVLAFPKPTHRVAVAVEAAMRAELASVTRFGNLSFSQDMRFMTGAGKFPTVGEATIPEDDPAFWNGIGGATRPTLMRLQGMDIEGITRDGRSVKATIKPDPFGDGSVVEFDGDSEIARALSGKIADRLAHPAHRHESPEDRAALTAFFSPNPATIPGVAQPFTNNAPAKLDPAVSPAASPGVDPEEEPR